MISAVHLLACGMDDVERRKVELLQIFAEYCDICSVPVAEIAYFLSIAGCVAYPGDITRSLISVSARMAFEISKYNPSIKSGNADVDLNEDLSNSFSVQWNVLRCVWRSICTMIFQLRCLI